MTEPLRWAGEARLSNHRRGQRPRSPGDAGRRSAVAKRGLFSGSAAGFIAVARVSIGQGHAQSLSAYTCCNRDRGCRDRASERLGRGDGPAGHRGRRECALFRAKDSTQRNVEVCQKGSTARCRGAQKQRWEVCQKKETAHCRIGGQHHRRVSGSVGEWSPARAKESLYPTFDDGSALTMRAVVQHVSLACVVAFETRAPALTSIVVSYGTLVFIFRAGPPLTLVPKGFCADELGGVRRRER